MSWCSSEVLSLPSQMGGCVLAVLWVGDAQPHSAAGDGWGGEPPALGVIAALLLLERVWGAERRSQCGKSRVRILHPISRYRVPGRGSTSYILVLHPMSRCCMQYLGMTSYILVP